MSSSKSLAIIVLLSVASLALLGAGQSSGIIGSGVYAPGVAGPAFVVETAQALGTNGGTTASINTTGANFLAACVTNLETVPTTLSDSASNTWTLVRTDNPGSQVENSLYYVYNPSTSATHTFTLAGTGSKSGVSVLGFSGMASNPLDQQNGANSSGNNTSFGPGSITPTTNNEVVIPCIGNYIAPSGTTVTLSSFSGLQQYAYSGTHYAGASAYQIQTAAAAANPSFSLTGTSAAQAASEASFISTSSTIANCSSCGYLAVSTNSGGSSVASDPTSLTGSANTGTLFIAFGWHTNWSGSGTTTTTDSQGATWHRCSDGGTGAFTDLKVTSTVGMSCNYSFLPQTEAAAGATIIATDCASNCTTLGGIYVAYSGVFIPRAWDAFSSNTFATAGSGSNNLTSGTLAVTQANDLVVVYCNAGSVVSAGSAGSSPISFTRRQNTNGTNEDAIYSSASSVTPTMSGTNGASYGCMAVAFK
jgi:hypothetical protein